MSGHVIEWAPFRLRSGVTENELLEASEALQVDFLEKQDGFVARDLLHLGGDQWADLVRWAGAAAAHRVIEAAVQSQVCHRYFQLMEGADHHDPGMGVQHFVVKRSYGSWQTAAA
jgi:hypothetical protein